MKIAILTASFGYNKLPIPTIVHNDVDYYAFVDKKFDCDVWKQEILFDFTIDDEYRNRRNAKLPKILPEFFLPNYDYYFWADITHDVVMTPKTIIQKYLGDNDIAMFKHTSRNCLYAEAEELKKLKYDSDRNIDNQVSFYKMAKYPKNNGLWELPVFVRKNTPRIRTLNLMLWELICRYSSRDQIAMPFCLWKLGINPTVLPGYANGFNSQGKLGNNDLMPQTRSMK